MTVAASFLPLAAGQSMAQVHASRPSLDVAMLAGGSALKATGSWVSRLKRGISQSITPVNAVEISCIRSSMTCVETRAELAGAAARPAADVQKDQLALSTLNFTVTEWTDARITARSDTRDGDLMLRIVPSEKLVRLSYWDTKGSKDKDGQSSGFMWELE